MGVGIEGEPRRVVSEHTRYRLDVHTILQRDGGERVPEVVKSDLGQSRSFENSLQHVVHAVRGDGAAVWGREYILATDLLPLCLENFCRVIRDGDVAVGVLCFQWRFHDLAVDSCHLSLDSDDPVCEIDVTPIGLVRGRANFDLCGGLSRLSLREELEEKAVINRIHIGIFAFHTHFNTLGSPDTYACGLQFFQYDAAGSE